jgi:hypothetical protein
MTNEILMSELSLKIREVPECINEEVYSGRGSHRFELSNAPIQFPMGNYTLVGIAMIVLSHGIKYACISLIEL